LKRFPGEFEALLSPAGKKVLESKHRRAGLLAKGASRFTAERGLIDSRWAKGGAALLERALADCLAPMEDAIPQWTISAMRENYAEVLPKTVRVQTALFASRRSRAWERAADIGLHALLRSQSFHAFAQALSGFRLRRGWGTQVLCYFPGDYAGPHNDHHPEEADARHGYVDLHLTFSNAGVGHQWLVYEQGGHFSQVESVAKSGTVTCYRLPIWHYATPMVARRGHEATARRWVLLGTFLDAAGSRAAPA
jgi:hypothetical protein